MDASHKKTTTTESLTEVLAPATHSTDATPKDDLYGFLIGRWKLDITAYPDDGNEIRSTGEAHAARVLEGRAVQDVFINPERSARTTDSPKFANWFGITFRFFDPTIRAWRAYWFNPDDGIRAELIARRVGNDVVQEGHFPDGTPIRWIYSDITPDSCRWRGERLEPDGHTWRRQVEFHARRA